MILRESKSGQNTQADLDVVSRRPHVPKLQGCSGVNLHPHQDGIPRGGDARFLGGGHAGPAVMHTHKGCSGAQSLQQCPCDYMMTRHVCNMSVVAALCTHDPTFMAIEMDLIQAQTSTDSVCNASAPPLHYLTIMSSHSPAMRLLPTQER